MHTITDIRRPHLPTASALTAVTRARLVPAPVPSVSRPPARTPGPEHRHVRTCYWDHQRCGWVCPPTTDRAPHPLTLDLCDLC